MPFASVSGPPRQQFADEELKDTDGKQPKPGDLIEIFRVTYQHWAVYIGEGNVVHLVTSEGASDVSTMPHKDQKGTVRKEKLKDVVGDSKWRINNYLDKERPPRCNNDIVKAACSLVDSELSYNPLSYNCKHFATEMRNGRVVSRQDGKQPKPGDLIEIFRVTYKHWAVYIGEGNVVHLVTSEGASDVSTMPHKDQKGTVRKEKLKNVVGDSKWRINNYLDEECPPRCNNDIVKAACNLVDSELSYNLFSHNCEHFATEMRNGRAVSRQVEKAKAAGAAGLAAAAGAAGLGSLASTASR